MSEQMVLGDGLEQLLSLEEKIEQTIQLLKATRAEKDEALRENEQLRQRLEEQARTARALEDRVARLEKERETVRTRVQRLVEQVDAVTAVRAEA
jgi:hypothetical protein